jgi:hypothetical protein
VNCGAEKLLGLGILSNAPYTASVLNVNNVNNFITLLVAII